jgi:hypothetical protein
VVPNRLTTYKPPAGVKNKAWYELVARDWDLDEQASQTFATINTSCTRALYVVCRDIRNESNAPNKRYDPFGFRKM